ncbi:MAG: Gfo/Idh/MocA family oxidoreductase, partial [Bacillota bacterium]|nr:Gfo/Idh/MocA family oxidoreductase [Bacillota bacterium]
EKFGPFNKDCWGISHIKQINDFYNTIRNGGEQYITAEDALETQKMICAIYESGRTKKRINF